MDEEKLSAYIAHLKAHPEEHIEFCGIKLSNYQKWYIRKVILEKDKLKMPLFRRF